MKFTSISPDNFALAPCGGGLQMNNFWVWDGSVIKAEDNRYHMFASRWPKNITFHPGWMTDSEVIRAVSDFPQGPFTFCEVVLPKRGSEWWDGRATHNPSITRYNDIYLLYYTGISHPLSEAPRDEFFSVDDPRCIAARAGKRVGLAYSKSVFGPWTRLDKPILETKPKTFYSYLTSNPAPCVRPDGSITLIFKARKHSGNTFGKMLIGLAKAENYLGPYKVVSERPLFDGIINCELEDPFLWHNGTNYELIAKDMGDTLTGEYHAGVHLYSKDALSWEFCTPKKAYSRTITWDDGVSQTMGQLERPFLLFENGEPKYFYAATMDGGGGFNNSKKSWNICIPLKPQKNKLRIHNI